MNALSIEGAALLMEVSEERVRELIAAGKLSTVEVGGLTLIPREEVVALLKPLSGLGVVKLTATVWLSVGGFLWITIGWLGK